MTNLRKMEEGKIKIDELKLSEYNPRKISEQKRKQLMQSVKEFGMVVPIVINKNPDRMNVVIGGHQRLDILKEMGWKEVPYRAVNLDITKERALNLVLNNPAGEFEEDKLIDVLMQIEAENEDVLSLTGFNTEEINYLLDLKEKDKEKIFAKSVEDNYETGNKHGIEEGDIVIFDKEHKILCGDSTDNEDLRQLLGDKKIDLIVTSPPYNVGKDYGVYKDNKEFKEYIDMIEEVFKNVRDFMNKGRYLCINIGKESGPINLPAEYNEVFKKLNYHFFRNIYWLKPFGSAKLTQTFKNPFPRRYVPAMQTEIIQIYSEDELPKELNALITYKYGVLQDDSRTQERRKTEKFPHILYSKYAGNVWEMQPETHLWASSGVRHPAPFPTQLPFNCIRFFTFEGERVLDPFTGSGTSMIATDQLKRKFYGIEIDPNYVSVAIDRYLIYKPDAKFEIIKREVKNGG